MRHFKLLLLPALIIAFVGCKKIDVQALAPGDYEMVIDYSGVKDQSMKMSLMQQQMQAGAQFLFLKKDGTAVSEVTGVKTLGKWEVVDNEIHVTFSNNTAKPMKLNISNDGKRLNAILSDQERSEAKGLNFYFRRESF